MNNGSYYTYSTKNILKAGFNKMMPTMIVLLGVIIYISIAVIASGLRESSEGILCSATISAMFLSIAFFYNLDQLKILLHIISNKNHSKFSEYDAVFEGASEDEHLFFRMIGSKNGLPVSETLRVYAPLFNEMGKSELKFESQCHITVNKDTRTLINAVPSNRTLNFPRIKENKCNVRCDIEGTIRQEQRALMAVFLNPGKIIVLIGFMVVACLNIHKMGGRDIVHMISIYTAACALYLYGIDNRYYKYITPTLEFKRNMRNKICKKNGKILHVRRVDTLMDEWESILERARNHSRRYRYEPFFAGIINRESICYCITMLMDNGNIEQFLFHKKITDKDRKMEGIPSFCNVKFTYYDGSDIIDKICTEV